MLFASATTATAGPLRYSPAMVSRSSKANRKGRNKGDGQYWSVPYAMLRSPAWRSLGGSAVKVYMELRTRFHGKNNGELYLSRDEAVQLLGMSKGTVHRAFKELESKGFIAETRQGVWRSRRASLYALTDRSLNGQPANRRLEALATTKNNSSVL